MIKIIRRMVKYQSGVDKISAKTGCSRFPVSFRLPDAVLEICKKMKAL
jgi:hypothetical protein